MIIIADSGHPVFLLVRVGFEPLILPPHFISRTSHLDYVDCDTTFHILVILYSYLDYCFIGCYIIYVQHDELSVDNMEVAMIDLIACT